MPGRHDDAIDALRYAMSSIKPLAVELGKAGRAAGKLGDAFKAISLTPPPPGLEQELWALLGAIDEWMVENTDKRWVTPEVTLEHDRESDSRMIHIKLAIAGQLGRPLIHLILRHCFRSVEAAGKGWLWDGWNRYNLHLIEAEGWGAGPPIRPGMALDKLLHELILEGGWKADPTPRFIKTRAVTGDLDDVRARFRPIIMGIDLAKPEPVERERLWKRNGTSCECRMPPLDLGMSEAHDTACPLGRSSARDPARQLVAFQSLGVSVMVSIDALNAAADEGWLRDHIWKGIEGAANLGWKGKVNLVFHKAPTGNTMWATTIDGTPEWDEWLRKRGTIRVTDAS
jgi:hypothetical protein